MKLAVRMPVLFLGHGSPMNAIADNAFTRALAALGARLPRPKSILCVSAHWLTEGTWTTGMERPRTIHDFGGFPDELYAVNYPAPGDPALAERVRGLLDASVDENEWGFDHGTWSVLRHMYPEADIPVVQLSVDYARAPRHHYELGAKLRPLRDEGVLIVGSGNVVHNLNRVDFSENARPVEWAAAFDGWVKDHLLERNFEPLLGGLAEAPGGRLAVPTPDHYDPLLYALGAADGNDAVSLEYEEIQYGSLSMLSARFAP